MSFTFDDISGGSERGMVLARVYSNDNDSRSTSIFSLHDRLIDEVLGHDSGDKVPMEKVVMLIWQFRDDPQVVKFMTRFVAKVRG